MEITSEATVDTIENSVNIVTRTKCINCLNITSSLSFLYNIIFKCGTQFYNISSHANCKGKI
jgi:hypothetical protein